MSVYVVLKYQLESSSLKYQLIVVVGGNQTWDFLFNNKKLHQLS